MRMYRKSVSKMIRHDQALSAILQTVNLLDYAYAGSNPALPTTFILSELKTKAPPQRRGFFFASGPFPGHFFPA